MPRILIGIFYIVAISVLPAYRAYGIDDPDVPWREYYLQARDQFLATLTPDQEKAYHDGVIAVAAAIRAEHEKLGKQVSAAAFANEFGFRWFRDTFYMRWFKSLSETEQRALLDIYKTRDRLRYAQDEEWRAKRLAAKKRYEKNHPGVRAAAVRKWTEHNPEKAKLQFRRGNLRRAIQTLLQHQFLLAAIPDIDLPTIREKLDSPTPSLAENVAALEGIYDFLNNSLAHVRELTLEEQALRLQLARALPQMGLSERDTHIMQAYWGLGEYAVPLVRSAVARLISQRFPLSPAVRHQVDYINRTVTAPYRAAAAIPAPVRPQPPPALTIPQQPILQPVNPPRLPGKP